MKRSIDWPHAPPHRLGSNHPYFVTAATHRKQHFFQSYERLDVLQRGLIKLTHENGWQLSAWAVFSNHYRFIASPPSEQAASLSNIISRLHSRTAAWINRLDEAPGRKVWHNYHDTILSFERSYFARLKYVHHNAVHHGLVVKPEDYPWCSASWFSREAKPSFVRTIESFKTDHLNIQDNFDPLPTDL